MPHRSLTQGIRSQIPEYALLLILLGVVFLLLKTGSPVPANDQSREHRRCARNLRQIGLSLRQYREQYGSLPPAWIADDEGVPMHSWRVLILPFLGEEERELYDRYRLDEPWDGPNNTRLHDHVPLRYSCSQSARQQGCTDYLAVVGPKTAWPGAEPLAVPGVTGRLAERIVVVESHGSGIHWMEPRDLHLETMSFWINDRQADAIRSPHRHVPHWSWEPQHGFTHVLMGDGSVRRLRDSAKPRTVKALLVVQDGKPD